MREYWMEVDAVCLSELEGMTLEQARAIIREEWETGVFKFRAPADAERFALAGDVLEQGQVVFRTASGVDIESPVDGVFQGDTPETFAVKEARPAT